MVTIKILYIFIFNIFLLANFTDMMKTFLCSNCGRRYSHQQSLAQHLKYECGWSHSLSTPSVTIRQNEKLFLNVILLISTVSEKFL